jgi:MFS family permease
MQVPQALLSDLFGVSKAVVGDHTPSSDAGQRSAVLGKLGAATGVGLMLGPAMGGKLLADRYQACAVGIVANLLVMVVVTFIPQAPHIAEAQREDSAPATAESKQEDWAATLRRGISAAAENCNRIVSLGRSASPAVQLLLALRFSLSLGFHIFNVSFMPSLKARFDMGPKDFGAFMGVVVRFHTDSFVCNVQMCKHLCTQSDCVCAVPIRQICGMTLRDFSTLYHSLSWPSL